MLCAIFPLNNQRYYGHHIHLQFYLSDDNGAFVFLNFFRETPSNHKLSEKKNRDRVELSSIN